MELLEHAVTELDALEFYQTKDEILESLRDDILELVKIFNRQGHTFQSASLVSNMFNDIVNRRRLSPLQGTDKEWQLVLTAEENNGLNLWQNRRCHHVFKNDNFAYDLEGIVFEGPKGERYTTENSVVAVTFPYAPNPQIVKVKGNIEKEEECEKTEVEPTTTN